MARFLRKDLNHIFSEQVKSYLERGYVICPEKLAMYSVGLVRAINGFESKILIRMHENRSSTFNMEPDQLAIEVLSVDELDVTFHSNKECIRCLLFYEISRFECYTDSREEAIKAKQLHLSRWKSRDYIEDYRRASRQIDKSQIPQSVKDSIMERIHKKRGFGKATFDCVSRIDLDRYGSDSRIRCSVYYAFKGLIGSLCLS